MRNNSRRSIFTNHPLEFPLFSALLSAPCVSALAFRSHNTKTRCRPELSPSRQSRKSYFFFELGFFFDIQSGLKFGFSQSNNPNKSPNAGLFVGTYALAPLDFGSGRLSRLRPEIVGKLQFRSMNLSSETWS
jgi:hypothetical protein